MSEIWPLVLGLVLILEGLLPLLVPRQWREHVQRLAGLRDGQIRFMGLAACLIGLAILSFSELK